MCSSLHPPRERLHSMRAAMVFAAQRAKLRIGSNQLPKRYRFTACYGPGAQGQKNRSRSQTLSPLALIQPRPQRCMRTLRAGAVSWHREPLLASYANETPWFNARQMAESAMGSPNAPLQLRRRAPHHGFQIAPARRRRSAGLPGRGMTSACPSTAACTTPCARFGQQPQRVPTFIVAVTPKVRGSHWPDADVRVAFTVGGRDGI